MGVCCCKSAPYSKPPKQAQADAEAGKDDMQFSVSPASSNNLQPMLEHTTLINLDGGALEAISDLQLCDDNTRELCAAALKLITALSIYHAFIDDYDTSNTAANAKQNICDMIYESMSEYNLLNLRDDSHHILTYHESNSKFMRKLFAALMEKNEERGITDLSSINSKLDEDQSARSHFGHSEDDAMRMVQALNQLHFDLTNEFGDTGSTQMHSDGGGSVDSGSDSDSNDELDDVAVSRRSGQFKRGKRGTMKVHLQSQKKNGYTMGNTVGSDGDESTTSDQAGSGGSTTSARDEEQRIDVRYTKEGKTTRKVGKLKVGGKVKEKMGDDGYKYKAKPHKVVDDDSWMGQVSRERANSQSKHVVTDSIAMLGQTKLVSKSSFKGGVTALGTLQENKFDLTSIDAEELNVSDGAI